MNVPAMDLRTRPDAAHKPTASLRRVLARIPEHLRAGFTAEQLAALDGALDSSHPTKHPINLRLTLFGQAYLVILAGPERRRPERRIEERAQHPLSSPGNVAFLIGIAIVSLTLGNSLRSLVAGG